MRKEMIIKKVKLENESIGWFSDRAKPSTVLLMIDHDQHKVGVEHLSGPAPDWESVMTMFMVDRDVRQELDWAATKYKRYQSYALDIHEGMSGARDLTLRSWLNYRKKWVVGLRATSYVAAHVHISMSGKLNEGFPDMFSWDLMLFVDHYLKESCGLDGYTDLSLFNRRVSRAIHRQEVRYIPYHAERCDEVVNPLA